MARDKLDIMHVAATLTQAAMSGRGGQATPVPIDPTNQDPTQRNLTLETWEVFRAFYAGVEGALADDKNWTPPTPSTTAPTVPTAIASILAQPAIQSAIASAPALAPLVTALKGIGVAIASAAPVAVPANPGAAPVAASS